MIDCHAAGSPDIKTLKSVVQQRKQQLIEVSWNVVLLFGTYAGIVRCGVGIFIANGCHNIHTLYILTTIVTSSFLTFGSGCGREYMQRHGRD